MIDLALVLRVAVWGRVIVGSISAAETRVVGEEKSFARGRTAKNSKCLGHLTLEPEIST